MTRGVVGAVIGGAIGAAIWAGIAYFTGYEVGWIAWGIGGLAGLGMRLGLGRAGGVHSGALAALVAVGAIVLGKWLAVSLTVDKTLDSEDFVIASLADVVHVEWSAQGRAMPPLNPDPQTIADFYPEAVWQEAFSRWSQLGPAQQARVRELPVRGYADYVVASEAQRVVQQRAAQGERLVWPPGSAPEMAWHELHFPAEVWAESRAQIDAMSAADRDAYIAEVDAFCAADYEQSLSQIRSEATGGGFADSFTPYDLLWAGLALFTAFRVAQAPAGGPAAPAAPAAGPEAGPAAREDD